VRPAHLRAGNGAAELAIINSVQDAGAKLEIGAIYDLVSEKSRSLRR
jgi:hypothetical protein